MPNLDISSKPGGGKAHFTFRINFLSALFNKIHPSSLNLHAVKSLSVIDHLKGIILATLGIVIAGGIPVSSYDKKEEKPEIKIELFESIEERDISDCYEIKHGLNPGFYDL